MAHIPDVLRQAVMTRANERCEYCQTPLDIVVTNEVDHIIPLSAGGDTTLDNLCLTCEPCNNSKGYHQTGIDPETEKVVALFNPRIQNWLEHFKWSDDYLNVIGLTEIGRATVSRCNMNRTRVVRARAIWLLGGWTPYPPTDTTSE